MEHITHHLFANGLPAFTQLVDGRLLVHPFGNIAVAIVGGSVPLEGFDDANATSQKADLPNHVAWTLGHLALTMHRAAERISGESYDLAWDPEPFAFGSTPSPIREEYPPLAELAQRHRRSLALLADAVRRAGDEGLARDVTWATSTTTARNLALRMVWHNGLHCGQIIDLRRALRLQPVIR